MFMPGHIDFNPAFALKVPFSSTISSIKALSCAFCSASLVAAENRPEVPAAHHEEMAHHLGEVIFC
jgi:hypothetical protein